MTTRPALSLFCAVALKGALKDSILPAFSQDTGTAVNAHFAPTSSLIQEITAGADPDVIIGITASLTAPGTVATIDAGTLTPLAQTGIGIAVAPDVEIPDVSTVSKLTKALTAARSVAYSRNGPSGIYFARLLQDLGIAEEVNGNATIIDQGFTAAALLDGRADLAIQQMSELMFVPEAQIAGPLPADVQQYTPFSAAVSAQTRNRPGSASLLMFLGSKLARAAYRDAGLEPS
ncbi:substrate-binding domain-containing protein [Arthrobacter methylotrophus]|uniref:Molybdate ABC transporter substrate-binding protein n=1 Tax=Arthrobacter methylotrophus TaxID=121291 RepID=A0ABV5UN42_9MICC